MVTVEGITLWAPSEKISVKEMTDEAVGSMFLETMLWIPKMISEAVTRGSFAL